jgi:hypothetical protein
MPIIPTPMAEPMAAIPMWMLPDSSANIGIIIVCPFFCAFVHQPSRFAHDQAVEIV